MKNKAYTITSIIYVEKFEGIKIHKLDYKSIRCIDVPRNLLKSIVDLGNSELSHISNSGIYFLQNLENQSLYVGQSDNLISRALEHNRTKDFDRILFFTTATKDWTKTHIDYLDWHYINTIKKQYTWKIDNAQLREREPNVSEFEKNPLIEIIKDIDILLLNENLNFEKESKTEKEENVFYYKKAKLSYLNGKWILLKGSIISNILNKTNDLNKNILYYEQNKNRMLKIASLIDDWKAENLISANDENSFILNNNIIVSSPSIAGCITKGSYAVSGWTEWKNANDKSLDDIYRK